MRIRRRKQKLTFRTNKISEARDSKFFFGFYEFIAINCDFFIWIDLQMQVFFLWSTEKNIISFKPSDTFLWQKKNKICPRTKIREKKSLCSANHLKCSLKCMLAFQMNRFVCWMAVRVKQLSSLISNWTANPFAAINDIGNSHVSCHL